MSIHVDGYVFVNFFMIKQNLWMKYEPLFYYPIHKHFFNVLGAMLTDKDTAS